MSLLLNPLLSVESSYNVKKLEEQGGLDTVLIGKNLWHSIVSDSDPDRVCISIAPRGERHTLPSLTCWAILDEKVPKVSAFSRLALTSAETDRRACDPVNVAQGLRLHI